MMMTMKAWTEGIHQTEGEGDHPTKEEGVHLRETVAPLRCDVMCGVINFDGGGKGFL